MAGTQLTPEKITSPFQLMAAWFALLVLIDTVLLTGAANIDNPDWAAGYLVVFASVVTLVVIGCVILMLTKFRPHLQEGKEYAQWLKDQSTYSAGYLVKTEERVLTAQTKRITSRQLKATPRSGKNFLISVVNAVGGVELVETLKNEGFNAEVYTASLSEQDDVRGNLGKNEGIWIGNRVDPKYAVRAIKIAVAHWPELKYLHVSADDVEPPDYVHDQMFFGGATSAARRYGLKAWSVDELSQLDESMTMEEFHAAVRRRYS